MRLKALRNRQDLFQEEVCLLSIFSYILILKKFIGRFPCLSLPGCTLAFAPNVSPTFHRVTNYC